ncbi:hypothetical protein OEA41_001551 [Lepraria neglecta]|uniref:C2H2-type domain-containing protein n=1 Tax=Lepraria neglecta TaxID=209136 RepID=A0AAD9ZCL2_9LECA|nr:hypothetical protein OEA41_001551 [Lepraria neglecta]
MNLTPQSMRSPMSPEYQQSKRSFSSQRPCYPATPQPEPASLEQPNRGLGIFDCPIPQQQSTVQELPPSPQPSDSWSHSSVMEQDFPQISQPPDIFTPAFDPFSGYSNGANSGMITTQSPEAPGLVFCQTPPSTNMPSHRSSISSSYSSPESFQHGNEYYTPRVKQEDPNEWYPAPGNDQVLQRSMTTQYMSPYNGISPINGPSDDFYKNQHNDWSKQNMGYPVDFTNEGARSKFDAAPTLPSVNRIKKKRQRTTPEEATHDCRVCGKLFKRSYNWKSHLETHNPERKYPHPCTAMAGNTPCTKKFQRKTDLDRHYDSVHLKARNHRCNLCGHRFARRDTLRRHTEDGCPKRFELGFREGSAATPARWSFTNFPARSRSYSRGMPQPSSMAPPMSATPSSTFSSYDRPQFVSSPIQAPSVFVS